MDDISFKDIRVLPSALDLKSNFSKSPVNLLNQLQSGSILNGLVVGTTPKGEIIFHTKVGRFAIPNALGLKIGDTLTLRFASEGEKISGTIITVNDSPKNSKESVTLAFVRNTTENQNISRKQTQELGITFDINAKLPEQVKGNVTYLNLSKINKSSFLYKVLDKASDQQNNRPFSITLKIPASNTPVYSTIQIQGEISSNEKDGIQLIKTNFGIITTTDNKLPVGQRMTFEIADFIFHLNKDWPSSKPSMLSSNLAPENVESPRIQALPNMNKEQLSNLSTQNQNESPKITQSSVQLIPIATQQIPNLTNITSLSFIFQSHALNIAKGSSFEKNDIATTEEVKQKILERSNTKSEDVEGRSIKKFGMTNLLKRFSDHKAIKELLSEYNSVKEMLITNEETENDVNNWHSLMIPLYNGREVVEQEIKLNIPSENLMRFIIDVDLEIAGRIRMDGLIKFHDNSKNPINFSLIVGSDKPLIQELENSIAEIFNLGKQLSGIQGSLSFDVV
jgi:hypothetical protein